MKLKIIFGYFIIFIISTACEKDAEDVITESYEVKVENSNNFGTLLGISSSFELEKLIIFSQIQKYDGGLAFASICKKNENDYLVVATGYGKYDDFAFSELVNFDINIATKKFAEISVFQENLAKIQTGGSSLLKIDDKTIYSFFWGKESTNSINMYMKKSIDNGLTWTVPKRINTIENEYQHAANNRAILLSTGRILLPMAIGGTGSSNYVFCYYSDDQGITWKATRMFKMENNELYEPCIEELADGRLIMTLRNSSGKIIFAFSKDKGIYWSDFVKSNIDSPDAPSTIAKIPGKDLLILIWNNNTRLYDYHFRSPLSLAISRDEGKTWNYLFDIENRPNIGAYYPTINFTKDKMLFTYTQKNVEDSKSCVVFSEIFISTLEKLLIEKTN